MYIFLRPCTNMYIVNSKPFVDSTIENKNGEFEGKVNSILYAKLLVPEE